MGEYINIYELHVFSSFVRDSAGDSYANCATGSNHAYVNYTLFDHPCVNPAALCINASSKNRA